VPLLATKRSDYVPERGDAVWLLFDPQAGHEQAGRGPAVVISPAAYNGKVGLALFCPVTSRVNGYPFEVTLPDELPLSGAVLSDQIKSLDWQARKAELICRLPDEVVRSIVQRVNALVNPGAPQ
jgi:mRNA interferase MazF